MLDEHEHAPLVIAHRATMGHAAENTLAGIRAGIAMGVDGVEVDVRLSRDGVPVLMHDDRVERTTGGAGRVSELPLAALRTLDVGGERVPTLREALETVGDRGELVIELKAEAAQPPDAVAEAVSADIERSGPARVQIWSFDEPLLAAMAQIRPELRRTRLCKTATVAIMDEAAATRLHGVALRGEGVSADIVAALEARGLQAFVWTVNDPGELRRIEALRVSGVVTDFPERLLAVLGRGEESGGR